MRYFPINEDDDFVAPAFYVRARTVIEALRIAARHGTNTSTSGPESAKAARESGLPIYKEG